MNAPSSDTIIDLQARLISATRTAARFEVDALLISPGPDLRYLTGYQAIPLERLTCLIVPAQGEARLVVPTLEIAAALASPVKDLGIEVVGWEEAEDPYVLVASLVGDATTVAVDDRMWAVKSLNLQAAMPESRQIAAGVVLSELRMRKSAEEVRQLQIAGEAIDSVHASVPEWLRVGRTENEVARDIANAILVDHQTADFVIVASGPNGSSPHHESSDRVIQAGDPVVVDIGGTTAAGYCSDSTRTYSMGNPDPEFLRSYAVLQEAQAASCEAVAPGVPCEEIDTVGRSIMSDAGLGELFIHRTGHGIGLETHEEPYIVEGNSLPLEAGMAFSIEPGFYEAGRWGARIEDIVVCGEDGPIMCNNQPHELFVIGP